MDILILFILLVFTFLIVWNLLFGSPKHDTSNKIAEIDRQMAELNDKAGERIKNNPDMLDIFNRAGVEIVDTDDAKGNLEND